MAGNSEIKQHVSIDERNKWDQVVEDFANHLGSGGTENHRMGDGTVPGFSTNDYTNVEKQKLAGVEDFANHYVHPDKHPADIIDPPLAQVAITGEYSHLKNIPETFCAGWGNCDTVGGIRFTVGPVGPNQPKNMQDVWFDTSTKLVKVYFNDEFQPFNAVWA